MHRYRSLSLATGMLLAALALAAPVHAQSSNEGSGVGVGVLGLITRATVKSDGVQDIFKSKTGSGFGLWVGGNKDGLVGFTGEFIYLIKNVDQAGQEFRTRALAIPALLRINGGSRQTGGAAAYAMVGPVFTMNLKQTLAGVDLGDNFSSADVGLIAGAGFEYFRLGVEARGNWGQRNISTSGALSEAKTFGFELVGKIRFN